MPPENNMPKHLKPSTQSSIALAQRLADPNVPEGTCPLCGHFMALNASGYCGTEQCGEDILAYAKIEKPEALANFGSIKVLLLGQLHRYKEPVPPEELYGKAEYGKCEFSDCHELSRPRDTLCNEHRKSHPKRPNNHGKSTKMAGNRIKGIENVRLKPKHKRKHK